MCKVSVIVPVYNVEKQIVNTVNSIINQTYDNLEIILVDDGSTDNSLAECRKFNDDRIVVYSKINGGASSARNYGLKKASGEYVTFIDSDDLYEENYIDKLMEYNTYDMVICGIKKIINNQTVNIYSDYQYDSKDDIKNNIVSILNSSMLNSPVNKLYKKSIIDKNGLEFDESLEIGEDYNFNFKYLINCEKVKCIKNLLYVYLVRDGSISSKKINDVISKRKINIDMTDEYLKQNNIKTTIMDNLKLKLIYIALMNDKNLKKEDIYNGYFEKLEVSGLVNKALYLLYKFRSFYLLKLISRVMIELRRHTKIKINGTSM